MLEVFTVDTKPCSPSVMQQPRNMPLRFPGKKTKLLVFPAMLNVSIGPKKRRIPGCFIIDKQQGLPVSLFMFPCCK